MSDDLPPANWYTDPVDESRYRYWDGTAWTSHRAPRFFPAVDAGVRGPGALIRDSFSTIRQQWRGCVVAALVLIAGQVAVVQLAYVGIDKIFRGEFEEFWASMSQPGFGLGLPDSTAYFESLSFDFSVWALLPIGIAVLVAWVTMSMSTAIAVLSVRAHLRNDPVSVLRVVWQGFRRTPRLVGVQLQISAIPMALLLIAVRIANNLLSFLMLVFLAGIVLLVLSLTVAPLAYVVASAGPRQKSLLSACRLLRQQFFSVFGRLLLVGVIVWLSVMAFQLGLGTFNPLLSRLSLPEFLSIAFASALGIFPIVAAAIIYSDLGGAWDNDN